MENRRPLSSRDIGFFQKFAISLVKMGLTPNQISVCSAIFAAVGGYSFYRLSIALDNIMLWWILAFAGIQLRLLCNLMDGLMAVEGGKKTPNGEIYNDFPDRISDVFLILGASYCIPYVWGTNLGWIASMLAVFTAYIRILLASMGKGHDFRGPMAKQHRMFVLTMGLIAWGIEYYFTQSMYYNSLTVAIVIIALGSLLTIVNRLSRVTVK